MRAGDDAARGRRSQAGYSYLVMLVMAAIFAVGLSAVLPIWSQRMQAERERELVLAGNAITKALRSYTGATPPGGKGLPNDLQELLEDRRGGLLRRHLRSIPFDPMTRGYEWGLLRDTHGLIRGVYSLADGQPLSSVLPPGTEEGASVASYQGWRFAFDAKTDTSALLRSR